MTCFKTEVGVLHELRETNKRIQVVKWHAWQPFCQAQCNVASTSVWATSISVSIAGEEFPTNVHLRLGVEMSSLLPGKLLGKFGQRTGDVVRYL